MKRVAWLCGMGLLLVFSASPTAEASKLSDGIGKVWSYVTAPVPCLANLGTAVFTEVVEFVVCVLNNANPKHLLP